MGFTTIAVSHNLFQYSCTIRSYYLFFTFYWKFLKMWNKAENLWFFQKVIYTASYLRCECNEQSNNSVHSRRMFVKILFYINIYEMHKIYTKALKRIDSSRKLSWKAYTIEIFLYTTTKCKKKNVFFTEKLGQRSSRESLEQRLASKLANKQTDRQSSKQAVGLPVCLL